MSSTNNQRIDKDVIMVGELLSLEDTNTTIYGNAQFIVSLSCYDEDGKQITIQLRHAISVQQLLKYGKGEGTLFALRYNKDNPKKTKVILQNEMNNVSIRDALAEAMRHFVVSSGLRSDAWGELIATGNHGKGLLLAVQPTGNIYHHCGELKIDVRITRQDGSTYEVTTLQTLFQEELPHAFVGNVLDVTYDREDEMKVWIAFGDWWSSGIDE